LIINQAVENGRSNHNNHIGFDRADELAAISNY